MKKNQEIKGEEIDLSLFIEQKKGHSPLILISTDWHLDKNNTEVVSELLIQKCELAKSLGLQEIFVLGDCFDSRKAQELATLDTFLEILQMITEEYGLDIFMIPGNHDKVDYSSESSYIAPNQYMKGVHYVKDFEIVSRETINIYLLPFFEEQTWLKYYHLMLEEHPLSKSKKNILLLHTAFSNSINNDGSKVTNSSINYSLLKDWDLVLSGHYHDFQQPFKNTYHVPSIRQKDFGENDNKGFTLINSDLSLEIKKSEFPKFITEKIDLSKVSSSEVKNLAQKLKEENSNVRVVLEGPIELVQSFDSKELESLGIKVKKVNPEIEASMDFTESSGQVEELTTEKILDLFKEFCKEESLDFKEGIQYLKE